jgi:hypothetical protein
MTIRVQVRCHKPDNADADRRIQGIGGINPNGNPWYVAIDDAIAGIKSGKWDFFVSIQYREVRVIVKTHSTSLREYLTTEGDGFPPNNLLSLPVCP